MLNLFQHDVLVGTTVLCSIAENPKRFRPSQEILKL